MGGGAKQRDIPEITSSDNSDTVKTLSDSKTKSDTKNHISGSLKSATSEKLDISRAHAKIDNASNNEDQMDMFELMKDCPSPALDINPHEPRSPSPTPSSTTTTSSSDVSYNNDTSSFSGVSSKLTSNKSSSSLSRGDFTNSPSSSSGYFSVSPSVFRSSSNTSSSVTSVFHQLDQERRGKLSVKVIRNISHQCVSNTQSQNMNHQLIMIHFLGYPSCKRSAFLQIWDHQCMFKIYYKSELENPL